MKPHTVLLLAAIAGVLAVLAGTFGAHGLEGRIPADRLATFEVGVRYHAYHAVALLALAGAVDRLGRAGAVAALCFAIGIAVFAGTLYALALTGQRWLGAITPVGGVLFIVGWAAIGVGAVRRRGTLHA